MINRQSINAPMLTSAVAIVLTAVVLLAMVPSLLSAMVLRGDRGTDPGQQIAKLVEEHRQEIELYRARFDGRSAFFRPPARPQPAPPPPPPPADDEEEEIEEEFEEEEEYEPPPPPPPPVPEEYDGPGVLFVLGDMVVFRSNSPMEPGKRLRVGQEWSGIDVVSVNPPRSVRLGYQPEGYERAEFDVPIFDWEMPGLSGSAEVSAVGIPGLLAADGATDFRSPEHYDRMIGSGIQPETSPPPRAAPPRPGASTPPRGGRQSSPARPGRPAATRGRGR